MCHRNYISSITIYSYTEHSAISKLQPHLHLKREKGRESE